MRFSATTAIAILASTVVGQSTVAGSTKVTGERGDATTVSNQPSGPTYTAVLPENAYGVKGGIKATQGKDGNGVHFDVEFSNLPKEGGPFPYHIHVMPVADGGNCSTTLAHLDPFVRGEKPPCDPSAPETCQTGDLSGKHGKVTSDPFIASYDDAFNSLVEGPGSFFGNRSFVFHFTNATRISCASFKLVDGGNGTTGGNSTGNGTVSPTAAPTGGYTTPTATGGPITGGASQMVASGVGLLGAFAAAAMLL